MNNPEPESPEPFSPYKPNGTPLAKAQPWRAWLQKLWQPEPALNDSRGTEGDMPAEEQTQQAILSEKLLDLHELTVVDVMTPRADIIAVELNCGLQDLLKIIVEHPFSRLPVYRGELDEVIGVVHIKDILDSLVTEQNFDLGRVIRDTKFVVPSMPVLDLLLEMRQTRVHMAMVIDEYGGIDGLVTIEDLLEQIVGDIEDERDHAQPKMIALGDGIWLSDARLSLDDFARTVGDNILSDAEYEEADTLAGLVMALHDRVPKRGETVEHPNGIAFDILEADNRRVKRLRVRRIKPVETTAAN